MPESLTTRRREYTLARHFTTLWANHGPVSAVIRAAAVWFASLEHGSLGWYQAREVGTTKAKFQRDGHSDTRPTKSVSVWFPEDIEPPATAYEVAIQVSAWLDTNPEAIRPRGGRPAVDSTRIYLPSVPPKLTAEQLRAGLQLAMSEPHHFPPQPRAERGTARAERKAGETRARTFTVSDTERDWLRANVTKKGGSVSRSLVTWAVTVTG